MADPHAPQPDRPHLSAEQFLQALAAKDLVPEKTLAALKKQVAEAKTPVGAAAIAKLLVEKGLLTAIQAQRLLGGDRPQTSKPAAEQKAARPGEQKSAAAKKPAAAAPAAASSLFDEELPPLEQAGGPLGLAEAGGSLLDAELGPMQGAAGGNPLDGLLAAGLPDMPAAGGADLAAAGPLGPLTPERRSAPWLTPEKQRLLAMLGGGGAAAIVLVVVIIWLFTRSTAEPMLAKADELYEAKSHAEAAAAYAQFAHSYPSHAEASRARVRGGVSQIEAALAAKPGWQVVYQTACETLDAIGGEPAFADEGPPRLAVALPAIAKGLAADASDRRDPDALATARDAIAHFNRYLATVDIESQRLDKVEQSLGAVERELARTADLSAALAAIKAAAAEGKLAEADRARREVLRRYPELQGKDPLESLWSDACQTQRAAVTSVKGPPKADATEPSPPAACALVERLATGKAPEAEGHVVAVCTGTAVYGLDAASGAVLWRRAPSPPAPLPQAGEGRDAFTPRVIPAVAVGLEPAGDLLLTDQRRRELLRVEARSGRLKWRLPLGTAAAGPPVVAGNKAWLATVGGALWGVDLSSGTAEGIALPQELAAAPAVDAQRGLLLQLGRRLDLFVLGNDGRCLQVLPLGDGLAEPAAAPVIVGEHVLLALNAGARSAKLLVLALAAEPPTPPQPWLRRLQTMALPGQVDTPAAVQGGQVAVATDRGMVHVFQLAAAEKSSPLGEVARGQCGGELTPRFAAWLGADVTVAGNDWSGFAVDAANKALKPKFRGGLGGPLVQPPVPVGTAVVCVAREATGGLVAAALKPGQPGPIWAVRLGSPVVELDSALQATTASGTRFSLSAVPAGETKLVEVAAPSAAPEGAGRLPTTAMPLSDEVAVVCDNLEVSCVEPASGRRLGDPFQPPWKPGEPMAWGRPVKLGDREFVISEGRRLFRLALQPKPRSHLAAVATLETRAVLGPAALVGETVWVRAGADALLPLQLKDNALGTPVPLSAACVWGPCAAGDRLVLAADDGHLWCLDNAGKTLWRVPLPCGPLAGPPLAQGEHGLFAAQDGSVWRAALADGKPLARANCGGPLSTGPVASGNRVWIGGPGVVSELLFAAEDRP